VLTTFQHYYVTQRLVGHNSVGSKTKSIRPETVGNNEKRKKMHKNRLFTKYPDHT